MTFNVFQKGDTISATLLNENFRDVNYGTDLLPKDILGVTSPNDLSFGNSILRWKDFKVSTNFDIKQGDSYDESELTASLITAYANAGIIDGREPNVMTYLEAENDSVVQFLNGADDILSLYSSTQYNDKAFRMQIEHSSTGTDDQRWSINAFNSQSDVSDTDEQVFSWSANAKSMVYSSDAAVFASPAPTDIDYIELSLSSAYFTDSVFTDKDGKTDGQAIICASIDSINGNSYVELNSGGSGYFLIGRTEEDTQSFSIRKYQDENGDDIDNAFAIGLLTGASTFSDQIIIERPDAATVKVAFKSPVDFQADFKLNTAFVSNNKLHAFSVDSIESGFTIQDVTNFERNQPDTGPTVTLKDITGDGSTEASFCIAQLDNVTDGYLVFSRGFNVDGNYVSVAKNHTQTNIDDNDINLDSTKLFEARVQTTIASDVDPDTVIFPYANSPRAFHCTLMFQEREREYKVFDSLIKKTTNYQVTFNFFANRNVNGFYDVDVYNAFMSENGDITSSVVVEIPTFPTTDKLSFKVNIEPINISPSIRVVININADGTMETGGNDAVEGWKCICIMRNIFY